MNSLETRLIELNQALYKLYTYNELPNKQILEQAQTVLAGGSIQTGPGNDTVIINNNDDDDDCECPPGPPGPQGEQGPPGECSCECSTIVVSEDYEANGNDYYIGVNSQNAVTVTLPQNATDCRKIIVKAEMGPPLGNRKVTINTADGSLIDGANDYIITVHYGKLSVICRDGDWWII